MRRFIKRYLLLLLIAMLFSEAEGQSLKILTYNIRLDTPDDGPNAWPLRRAWLCEQVRSAGPDIFGIQEGLPQQVKYIDSMFSGYHHTGVGREDGKNQGEFSAIWYDMKKFLLVSQGTFWLSPTPEAPSMGWDAACKRICTYGLFKDIRDGRQFWVFNTHFDHAGVIARRNSADLILRKIDLLNKTGLPVILMGDFNGNPESKPVKIICRKFRDSKIADKSMTMMPDGTFNGFDPSKPVTERIDFIFTGYGAEAVSYGIIREKRDGKYASDHFPVIAVVKY